MDAGYDVTDSSSLYGQISITEQNIPFILYMFTSCCTEHAQYTQKIATIKVSLFYFYSVDAHFLSASFMMTSVEVYNMAAISCG